MVPSANVIRNRRGEMDCYACHTHRNVITADFEDGEETQGEL